MSNRTRKTANLISQLSYNFLEIVTDKSKSEYGQLKFTKISETEPVNIDISDKDVYSDYVGFGTFFINSDGFLVSNINLSGMV